MAKPDKELNIEIAGIKKLMDLLSDLFSIRTAFIYGITDEYDIKEIAGNMGDFQPFCQIIQKELKHKCTACDMDKLKESSQSRLPLLYRCYNGLYEMVHPLFMEDSLIGYLHFGQVRSEESFDQIYEECGLGEHSQSNLLREKYEEMQIIPKEKLYKISELFAHFSDIILQNRMVEIKRSKPEFYLRKYMEDNYAENIRIEDAADYIGKSPSWITHQFKRQYKSTFHSYLMNYRIKKAQELLQMNPIHEVAEACGFKNRYHFSKVFKKVAGKTPRQYKLSSS